MKGDPREGNFKNRAYSVIKAKIINCELMPRSILDQTALMQEIGVSRTPIREAIHALEQEGLVVIMPRRAVLVSSISLNELEHIYTVREALEPLIVRLATPAAEQAELQNFHRIFSGGQTDYQVFCRNDFLMHNYFAQKTGNPYLIRLMENVLSQNLRVVVMGAKIPDRLADSNREHVEVIERMLARDAEGAEAAMRRHIASAKKVASIVNTIL